MQALNDPPVSKMNKTRANAMSKKGQKHDQRNESKEGHT